MKLTKLKLFLGLFLLVLSTTLLVLAPSKVIAANFVDGKGAVGAVNRGDNSRFVFQDPFTITDTENGTSYTTKSTACGGDNMYVCASGDVMHPGSYWYWPGGQELGSQNGQCVSALVLMVRQTPGGTGLNQARIYAVNAHPGALSTGCYVQDTAGHKIKTADIDGWGAMPEDDSNAQSHSSDAIVMSSDVTRLDAGNSSDHGMFAALATEFNWVNSGEIDSIADPGVKSLKITDTATVQQISTALNKDSNSTKPYATGYDYFIPTQCVDDSNQFKALLAVKQSDPTSVVIIHRQDGDTSKGYLADGWQGDQQSCLYRYNHWNSPNRMWGGSRSDVTIGLADKANAAAAPTAAGGGGGSPVAGGSDSSDSLDCGAGEWNWLICSGSQLIIKASDGLNTVINGLLTVSTSNIFGSKSDSGYYTAWNSFRVISIAVIVIAGLVMVTSEALGFEFLDAYTIRKTLPRLLVAVIGISISWPVTQFFIQLFNVLGKDIEELIAAPFASLHQNNVAWVVTLTNPLTVLAAAGGALLLYGPTILTFGITAFLAALIAVLILVVRQTAIIVLVILAPLAIACYVLPNTQKAWNFWRENFIGLLMVYPIITAFIAAGRVMSAAASSHTDSGVMGAVYGFIAITAYFLPYFLLPVAFRIATGIIGNVSGFVNDRSKGAFDRLKKGRQNKVAENTHKMKSGGRFSDRNAVTRGFNRTTFGAAAGAKGGFGFGERGKQGYDIARRNAAANDVMKSAGWNGIQHNDDALRALTYDSAADAKAAGVSDEAIAAARASVGFGRAQAIAAAQQMAVTGTSYKDIDDVRKTIARAAGGNESTVASLAGNINSETKRAGRHDLAPGYAALNDLSRQSAGMSNSGQSLGEAQEKAWGSGSLYQHANDKGANIDNAIKHHTGLLGSSDVRQREKAAVFFNELKSMQPNATGDVKDKIQVALDSNRAQIDTLYDDTHANYLGSSASGIADKSLGRVEQQVYDSSTGNYTKNVVSTGTRSENAKERVERLSRTYERPDPNNV
jgi:hypothetical protein